MTSKTLKWIAIIMMTIDHIGLYLVTPEDITLLIILRGLGRLAFPFFAFFVSEGFKHTHDVKKYFFRLLGYAVLIQIALTVFYFASGVNYMIVGNVFWPLVFGLLASILIKERKTAFAILGFSLIIIADLIGFPYGGYGVAFILIFTFVEPFYKKVLYAFIVHLAYIAYPIAFLIPEFVTRYNLPVESIQWLATLSFIPIYFYNGKLGKMNKYFFYIYYPVHLAVIFGISLLI